MKNILCILTFFMVLASLNAQEINPKHKAYIKERFGIEYPLADKTSTKTLNATPMQQSMQVQTLSQFENDSIPVYGFKGDSFIIYDTYDPCGAATAEECNCRQYFPQRIYGPMIDINFEITEPMDILITNHHPDTRIYYNEIYLERMADQYTFPGPTRDCYEYHDYDNYGNSYGGNLQSYYIEDLEPGRYRVLLRGVKASNGGTGYGHIKTLIIGSSRVKNDYTGISEISELRIPLKEGIHFSIPINIGSYNQDFTYQGDMLDLINYVGFYNQNDPLYHLYEYSSSYPVESWEELEMRHFEHLKDYKPNEGRNIVYEFTLEGEEKEVHIYSGSKLFVLNEKREEIIAGSEKVNVMLKPGKYYVVTQSSDPNDFIIIEGTTNIPTEPEPKPGDSINNPIILESPYLSSVLDFNGFKNSYGDEGKDIFYQLTIDKPHELTISGINTKLYVLDSSGRELYKISSSDSQESITLTGGTYILVVEEEQTGEDNKVEIIGKEVKDPEGPDPEEPDPGGEDPGDGENPDPPLPTHVKGLLITSYTYNIRSWTTSITTKKEKEEIFSQKLDYNETTIDGNTKPQYGGNISAINWKAGAEADRSYNFHYDQLSRLTDANYQGIGNYTTSHTYDMHGNLKTTKRYGDQILGIPALVDDIKFEHFGNQLIKATDTGVTVNIEESADFKNYADKNMEYLYNANGAMTKDLNKGIDTIVYNALNLPVSMKINNQFAKGSIDYTYSAAGVKLRTVHTDEAPALKNMPIMSTGTLGNSPPEPTITDYVGNKIYENGELKRILVDGGYIDMDTGEYHFYVSDHLGNNRAVVRADGEVIQQTHYYPFGMAFADSKGREEQAYKYNSKELDTKFQLNTYDYAARYMDPSIGRFTSVDPLAEKYYSWSPYAYVGNNPLRNIDINGDSITTIINTTVSNTDGTTSIQSNRYYYGQDVNGDYGFIGANGQNYSGNNQFISSLSNALSNLRSGGNVGHSLVSGLMNSTKVVNVGQGNRNTAAQDGSYITWNPNSTTGGMNTMGNENRPSYIGLGHEMGHIQGTWNGTIDNSPWMTMTIEQIVIPNSEKYATHIENQLRAENNLPLRTHYGIDVSTGTRQGLRSTGILSVSGTSKFYMESNRSVRGILLLSTPFKYKK